MPNYFYTAKSFYGETITGTLDANDEWQLAQSLKGQGMVLIKAIPKEKKHRFNLTLPSLFSRVSLAEKIMITKSLGIMFSTGLSLVKSFDVLKNQAKNKRLKNALMDIKEKISKGENLSDVLSTYPAIFSELFCNMVKVGEESGTLDEVFSVLTLQLEKEHELKSKIKNAMIYPSIILMVMAGVAVVMVTVVLPSLDIFFTSLNVEIPIYTKILLAAGRFLSKRWYVALLFPVALFSILFLILKSKSGKKATDTLLLRLPAISQIIKKSNAAFLIRSLSSLISAGIPLTRALEISSRTVDNHYFREALGEAEKKIKKGEKLSSSLKPHQNIFPVGVIEMIEVGEETGKTSVILKKLADFYEQEAIAAIEKLSILIEPVLIIVLGLGVGLFALSIIEPMYSSLSAINE